MASTFMSSESLMFTSESVTEGHPDKICDQISDAVLDACLEQDPVSRVACEVAAKTGFVMLMGEVTTKAQINYDEIARKVITEIGYDDSDKGFDGNSCGVLVAITKQSGDIAMGVDIALEAKTGEMSALCIINGFTLGFVYEKNARAMISLEKALELLKNGAISKSDFVGDIDKVLAESTIANNAVFTIKDLRIAGQTIHDINIIVRHDLHQSLILGNKVLSEIGEISIDKRKKEMIFK